LNLTAIRERVAIDAVRLAPKALYSAALGWVAGRHVPPRLRSQVYGAFARYVGANLDEPEMPLEHYPTLGDFFARRLRADARPLPTDPTAIAMPCDGRVAASGVAAEGHLVQAKGRDYTLSALLADADAGARLEGGAYVTIYLSPADYHRVHSPVSGRLIGYDYVPGALFPVSPMYSRGVDNLLSGNERIVFRLDSDVGEVAVCMVAAAGVANMSSPHGTIDSWALREAGSQSRVRFDTPIAIERGDELGAFHLGSTVVTVFSPGRVELTGLDVDAPVQCNQTLGRRFSSSNMRTLEGRG
jgi:phosphatidylserine decarboxylase